MSSKEPKVGLSKISRMDDDAGKSPHQQAWVILAVVLLVLFSLAFWAKAKIQARLQPGAIQTELSKTLGIPTHLDGFGVTWTGGFELLGVRLENESKTFLSTPTARARVKFSDLIHGKVSLSSLELDSPSLSLDSAQVGALSKLLHGKKMTGGEFPLSFSNGTFAYTALNGKQISFGHVDGTFNLNSAGTPFHLKFRDSKDGRYDFSGSVTADTLDLSGKLNHVVLSEVVTPLGINPIPELQGEIDGHVTATGKFDQLALNSEFTEKTGIFKGNAIVSATLEATPSGSILKGKLYSDHGQVVGVGDFKAFGVNFSTPSQGFVFQDGTVEFPSGIVQFSGAIQKNYAVTVHFKSASFDPFALPNFSGWGLRGSPGRIDGTASGTFPQMGISTTGHFDKLWLGQNELDHAALNLAAHVGLSEATIDRFALSSPQGSFSLGGRIQWDNDRNLNISFNSVNAAELARLFRLESRLSPLAMTLAGSTSYTKSNQTWKGTATASHGMIAGESFDLFGGDFSYRDKQPVNFSGTFNLRGRKAVVSGTWGNNEGNFKLDAAGFPLQQLPFLKGSAAGFQGIADIHASFTTKPGSQSQISFSLPSATYKGRPVPAMDGAVSIKNDQLTLSPVRLLRVSPPLSITGHYNLKSKAMRLDANLNGQDPKSLLSFLGNQSIPMTGLLYGKASMVGTYPSLWIQFSGDVQNARFQGFTFDKGHLSLAGSLPSHFKVNFQTDRFSPAQFAMIHELLPQLSGTGTLSVVSGEGKSGADISFSIHQTYWGNKPLGILDGVLAYRPPLISIMHLSIPLTQPPLSMAGSVNLATKGMELRSTLDGQSISGLAKAIGKSFGSGDGNLYGTLGISGFPPETKFTFNGSVKNLKFSGMDLGDAQLALAGTAQGKFDVRASGLEASRVSILQKAFPGLSGELQFHALSAGARIENLNFQLKNGVWEGKTFPTLEGSLAWEDPLAKFSSLNVGGISPPLHAAGKVNSQTHEFDFETTLAGQRLAELSKMMALKAGDFDAKLYGPLTVSGNSGSTNLRFSGTGSSLRFRDISLGSGHLDFSAQSTPDKHFAVHVKGSGISASSISLLEQHFPGISGNVRLDVSLNTASPNQASIDFSLKNASRNGRPFPELDGSSLWVAPRLQFSPITAPGLSPPLSLTGSYHTDTEALNLSAQLEGQSISDLLELAGTSNTSANGRLYGPVTVSGSSRAPRLEFNGEVTGLAYKGIQLGRGQLEVTSTPNDLNGKLTLDQPVELDPGNSLLGTLIQQIPHIGGILGQMTSNVIVTGVIIRGTPHNPEFTPIFERTAVQNQNPLGPFGPLGGQPQQQRQPQQPSNPIFDILNQVLGPQR